jgi:hypothetical protein
MATVTDSDLKELKDLITDIKISQGEIKTQLIGIDNRISKLEGTLQAQQPYIQKIPDMAEKIGELKNWKQIALTIGGAFTGAIITYLAKNPNP